MCSEGVAAVLRTRKIYKQHQHTYKTYNKHITYINTYITYQKAYKTHQNVKEPRVRAFLNLSRYCKAYLPTPLGHQACGIFVFSSRQVFQESGCGQPASQRHLARTFSTNNPLEAPPRGFPTNVLWWWKALGGAKCGWELNNEDSR